MKQLQICRFIEGECLVLATLSKSRNLTWKIIQILEQLIKNFIITMVNVLKAPVGKV